MERDKLKMSEENVNGSRLESRKEAISNKISNWFKNPLNKVLFFILLFAIGIRLFYFIQFNQQPLWFDEAEYMIKSQRVAFHHDTWRDYWSPRKPILLAWIFIPFFQMGFTEPAMKFILLLFSVLAVFATYLVSKEFFNKKIALIATALTSVFWVHLFLTPRFLVELPATPFYLLSLYYFYKGYIKKENPKYLWLFGVFFAIGFLMRVSYGIYIIPIIVFLLFEDKWKFILNKDLWIAGFLVLLVISPYAIWLMHAFPQDTLGMFIGIKTGRFAVVPGGPRGFAGLFTYFQDLPNVLKLPFFVLFILGVLLFFADLFLGLDLIFKKESKNLRIKILILLWIIIPMIAFGMSRPYTEQRDTSPQAVFFFSIIGIALFSIYGYLSKYNKQIAALVVGGLLIVGAIPQITYGYDMTNLKASSYLPVKEAALWMKQNSKPTDIIFTMDSVATMYYAERDTYSTSSLMQEELEGMALFKKPKYLVLSSFEPANLQPKIDFAPWLSNHSDIIRPVNAWFADKEQQQPILIIYEFNWNNYKKGAFSNFSKDITDYLKGSSYTLDEINNISG